MGATRVLSKTFHHDVDVCDCECIALIEVKSVDYCVSNDVHDILAFYYKMVRWKCWNFRIQYPDENLKISSEKYCRRCVSR